MCWQYIGLRTLDLSWNAIEAINGLEALGQLRELKLYHNKLTTIENLTEYAACCVVVVLTDLRVLESYFCVPASLVA